MDFSDSNTKLFIAEDMIYSRGNKMRRKSVAVLIVLVFISTMAPGAFCSQVSSRRLSVAIVRPRQGFSYINDEEMDYTGKTLVYGRITIEATVTSEKHVEKVDFYIDEHLKKSDYVEPYTCILDDTSSSTHTIKVEAFDITGTRAEHEHTVKISNERTHELLNEDEASQILIEEVIKPEELLHDIIAFTLHRSLEPGDVITSMDNDYTIDSPQWFFWINDFPYLGFAHRTRYVFIDAENADVNIIYEYFPPWLNGVYLWEDYFCADDWVFSTYIGPIPLCDIRSHRNELKKTLLVPTKSDSGKKEAIIVKGADEVATERDCRKMEGLLREMGFNITYIDAGENPENAFQKLKDEISRLQEELESCDELLLYIDSHGGQYDDPETLKVITAKKCNDKGFVAIGKERLSDSELASLLKDFADCVHIKVIISACFSGCFIDDLKELKNIEVIITSTDHDSAEFPDMNTESWEKLSWVAELYHLEPKIDDDKGKEREGLKEFIGGLFTAMNAKKHLYKEKKQQEFFEMVFYEALEYDEAYQNRTILERSWEHLKSQGDNPGGWGANFKAEEPQIWEKLIAKKWIWNSKDTKWKKEADVDVCNTLKFKLIITNNCKKEQSLFNITVIDMLPSNLKYTENSAKVDGNPKEPKITPNQDGSTKLEWTFPKLDGGKTLKIIYDAHAESPGKVKNCLEAYGEPKAYDEDEVSIDIYARNLAGIYSIYDLLEDNVVELYVRVINDDFSGLVYDIEIFPEIQQPPWQSVEVLMMPEGWEYEKIGDGVRFHTTTNPLIKCQLTKFVFRVKAKRISWYIRIHITNEYHESLGEIVSTRRELFYM